MKILNFTVVEILPSLLDKSKTQTIRPAWKKPTKKEIEEINKPRKYKSALIKIHTFEKSPRFKVSEKVMLVWNQRSKYKIFCAMCGKAVTDYENKIEYENFMGLDFDKQSKEVKLDILKNAPRIIKTNCGCNQYIFNKILGIVEITEVFEIKLSRNVLEIDWLTYHPLSNIGILSKKEDYKFDKIAERDGFKSAEEMFNWFNKEYDLSLPKEFWVYRWAWG